MAFTSAGSVLPGPGEADAANRHLFLLVAVEAGRLAGLYGDMETVGGAGAAYLLPGAAVPVHDQVLPLPAPTAQALRAEIAATAARTPLTLTEDAGLAGPVRATAAVAVRPRPRRPMLLAASGRP